MGEVCVILLCICYHCNRWGKYFWVNLRKWKIQENIIMIITFSLTHSLFIFLIISLCFCNCYSFVSILSFTFILLTFFSILSKLHSLKAFYFHQPQANRTNHTKSFRVQIGKLWTTVEIMMIMGDTVNYKSHGISDNKIKYKLNGKDRSAKPSAV